MSRRREVRTPPAALWLPPALLLLALPFAGDLPVLDEESYLFIAESVIESPGRPYDWWRPWQPWGMQEAADSFLFAHPPLHLWWVAFWKALTGTGWGFRLGVTLLPAALLAASVGRLAHHVSRRPSTAVLPWLFSPVVVMAVCAGGLPDLAVTALGTAAVAAWREAQTDRKRVDPRFMAAAGVLLGLAACWKYPALVLVPVLTLHAWRRGILRQALPAALGFAVVWGAMELWLATVYGRVHLLEVLRTAPEIARGSFLGRGFGVLTRLGLALSPLLLVVAALWWRLAVAGLVGSVALALLWIGPSELSPLGVFLLGVFGASGTVWVARAVIAVLPADKARRRKNDRDDAFLLGAWALAVLLGVWFGHNYAGGRYVLPAIAPLALLIARTAENLAGGKNRLRVATAAWGLVAVVLADTEARYANAAEQAAERAIAAHPASRFTGEWTFRWTMERAGWTVVRAGEILEPGTLVAVPRNGGGQVQEGWEAIASYEADDPWRVRTVELEEGVGYHAETLGPLPVGWSTSPLEAVTVYRVTP